MPTRLSYEEPPLIHLLVLGSFLYVLNTARVIADHLLYAGLVAEIALGIVYGSPLANILPVNWETTFTTLGYLGLILVVFEGMDIRCSPSSELLTSTGIPRRALYKPSRSTV